MNSVAILLYASSGAHVLAFLVSVSLEVELIAGL